MIPLPPLVARWLSTTWLGDRLRRFATRNLPKPAVPPLIAAIYAPPDIPPQSDRTEAGVKSVRRVCMKMQQQQYALTGWNYARKFRS